MISRTLESSLAEARDKAIRFDLDQAGIEWRERYAVELVELRASLAEARAKLNRLAAAAHMAVDNQLTENEADRALYRRAIRAVLQELEGE